MHEAQVLVPEVRPEEASKRASHVLKAKREGRATLNVVVAVVADVQYHAHHLVVALDFRAPKDQTLVADVVRAAVVCEAELRCEKVRFVPFPNKHAA